MNIFWEEFFWKKRSWIDCGAKAQNSAKMFSGIWYSWTEGWVIGTANCVTRLLATRLVKMQSIKWNIAWRKWIQSSSVFFSIIRFVCQLLFQGIMIAQANVATVLGIEAHPITVEVDVAIGLSAFNIVGLPDNTIRESRDRILAALSNCGFSLPPRKI